MSRCWSGAPVPVVLERPASADGPRLDAVGDRDRLHPVGDRVELGEAAELVERGEHAGADALGGLMAAPRAPAAPTDPAVARPHPGGPPRRTPPPPSQQSNGHTAPRW